MMKVAIIVPNITATAVPEAVSLLSKAMQRAPPALSVVQYIPSAQALAVAVDVAQVVAPEVTAQVEVVEKE